MTGARAAAQAPSPLQHTIEKKRRTTAVDETWRRKTLSSRAPSDDEFDMRTTLSQPLPRSGRAFRSGIRDRRTCLERGIALGLLASLFLVASACNRIDHDDAHEDATKVAANPDSAGDASDTNGDFEWPDDPSHPILTLSIESDRETGTIAIELMPELAPATVAHVIALAKEGFYDGTTFHRVIPGFMIQGGDPNSRDRDPNNDGMGISDTRLNDEFGPAPFVRGVVGMGNTGRPNSSGSQFFIMHADNRSLDGRYTVIGRVVSGMDVVDAITRVPIDRIGRWGPKDRPMENVVMKRVGIRGQMSAEPIQSASRNSQMGGGGADL